MNTFSQLLHTLLGIGTEPRALTFLQVSVRGVIVFIATLIMMRLGSKRSLAEKTAFDAVLIVIIGSMLARAINGSEAFFRPWALDSFWCSCIGFSVSRRTIHMVLGYWLRDNRWCSCRTAGCSGKTCSGNTFPNMIWKKICASMRIPRTYQKYKLRDSNAAETSALSKRIVSGNRRGN